MNYFKVSTDPILIRIVSEPYVVMTFKGYAPVVDVLDCKSEKLFVMFISAKSISESIETMKKKNENKFTGLEFWIRKESSDKLAPYVIEEV